MDNPSTVNDYIGSPREASRFPHTYGLSKAVIIGCAKCGTTSLWYYLSKHPEVFAHPDKELKFFYARDVPLEDKLSKPGCGFEDVVAARKQYLQLYESKIGQQFESTPTMTPPKVLLEGTPGYFFNPRVPARIRRILPEAKLLLVVRDPVARALSEWRMRHFSQKNEGKTVTIDLFEEETNKDIARLERAMKVTEAGNYELDWDEYLKECSDVDQAAGINCFQPLIGRGMYVHQLRNWYASFPDKSQIHIISSDDLRADPVGTLNKVAKFLGVDPTFYESTQKFLQQEMNVGGTTFKSSMREVTSTQPAAERKAPQVEPVPQHVEDRLRQFFAPHNALFYATLSNNTSAEQGEAKSVDLGWGKQKLPHATPPPSPFHHAHPAHYAKLATPSPSASTSSSSTGKGSHASN